MFKESKGITCSSMYVGVSHCSSTAIKMDEVTIAGGVCLTNNTSSKAGELLFLLYRLTGASCKIKTQMLYISRGMIFQAIPKAVKAEYQAYI